MISIILASMQTDFENLEIINRKLKIRNREVK